MTTRSAIMKRCAAAVAILTLWCVVSARGEDAARAVVLEKELGRLTEGAKGRVGVAAIHLGTGEAAYLNAGEAYPMASTFKVPVAVRLLERVDAGELKLDQMIEVKTSDLSPGSGMMTQRLTKPGVQLSVANLLDLMLVI